MSSPALGLIKLTKGTGHFNHDPYYKDKEITIFIKHK